MTEDQEVATIEEALRTMREAGAEIVRLRGALNRIQFLLDGRCWHVGCLEEIAAVLRLYGFPVDDVDG